MSTVPPLPQAAPSLAFSVAGASDPGREREENEDAFGLFPRARLVVVADGMGGRAGGAMAARIGGRARSSASSASSTPRPAPPGRLPSTRLSRSGRTSCGWACRWPTRRSARPRPAGPTCTAWRPRWPLWRSARPRSWSAHVGDVRVYRLRSGDLDPADPGSLGARGGAGSPAGHHRSGAGRHRPSARRHARRWAAGPRSSPRWARTSSSGATSTCSARTGCGGRCRTRDWQSCFREWSIWSAGAEALIQAANAAGGPDNITAVLVRIA